MTHAEIAIMSRTNVKLDRNAFAWELFDANGMAWHGPSGTIYEIGIVFRLMKICKLFCCEVTFDGKLH